MEYKSEAVYEEKDFIGFMKVFTSRDDKLRGMAKVSTLCAQAGGTVMFLSGAINFVLGIRNGLTDYKALAIQLVMAVLGVFLFRLPVNDLSGKRMWRQYQGQGAKIGFIFYPDHYEETRQGNFNRREYSSIESLEEDEERFYLFKNAQTAEMIRKDAFSVGTAEGFRSFIAEKTGRQFPEE